MLRRFSTRISFLAAATVAAVACAHAPARQSAPEASATTVTATAPAAPDARPRPPSEPARTAQTRAAPPRPEARRSPSNIAPRAVNPPMPAALRGVTAPVWHVGDQWAFRWESSDGQGDYVWTVVRTEIVDGGEQYVVRSGPREIHFRARDLATSLETLGGAVEVRHVPPRTSFSWPLTPGTIWQETYTEERGPEQLPLERTISWLVEGEERVRVDAGTFDTLKIVAHHDGHASPAVMYEMWYAPAAKQFVRLKEYFPAGIRYRELTDFVLG